MRSAHDDHGAWHGRLYHANFDWHPSKRGIERVRLGRQFIYERQPFHFDGVRVQSTRGAGGLSASAFAGIPVHPFDRPQGTLAGAGIECRPWRGAKLSALYAVVDGGPDYLGLPAADAGDSLLVLSAASRIKDWGTVRARSTSVDSELRDFTVETRAYFARPDLRIGLSYYSQPRSLTMISPDLSSYESMLGSSLPFRRLDATLTKGRPTSRGRVAYYVAATIRELEDSGAEGDFNRDFKMLHLGVRNEMERWGKLTSNLGVEWWWSSQGRSEAFEAEVDWRPVKHVRIGAGTSFSLYKYDFFSGKERHDVTEIFLRGRWRARSGDEWRVRLSLEREGWDTTTELRVRWTREF